MKRLSPYSIGETPNFDPCEKCIIKVNCSELCDDRLKWYWKNMKTPPIKIKFGRKRRKKKC